jgi:hypothetical protein
LVWRVEERVTIQEAQQRSEAGLLALPNVTGVAIGERRGKEVIKVFVTTKVSEEQLAPRDRVPKVIDGYETDVEQIGVVTAQTD